MKVIIGNYPANYHITDLLKYIDNGLYLFDKYLRSLR